MSEVQKPFICLPSFQKVHKMDAHSGGYVGPYVSSSKLEPQEFLIARNCPEQLSIINISFQRQLSETGSNTELLLVVAVYLTTLFQHLRLYSVDF
jgi:hypothetical protein